MKCGRVLGRPCLAEAPSLAVTSRSGRCVLAPPRMSRAGVGGSRTIKAKACQCAFYLQPAALSCDMVLHQVFRARCVRKTSIGGRVRHGVKSGASCETSKAWNVTPHLHREYRLQNGNPHAKSLPLGSEGTSENRCLRRPWVFITGGCSGRGVQWMGVVPYSKLVYNTTQITTPCFHCTPLWWILSPNLAGTRCALKKTCAHGPSFEEDNKIIENNLKSCSKSLEELRRNLSVAAVLAASNCCLARGFASRSGLGSLQLRLRRNLIWEGWNPWKQRNPPHRSCSSTS